MKIKIGHNANFIVRKEIVNSKKIHKTSVVFLSDFHFNKYSKLKAELIGKKIDLLNPDIILFGGDYVDSSKGLKHLETILKLVSKRKNVFAIGGNHDNYFGLDIIKSKFIHYGITWLDQESICLKNKNIFITNNPSCIEKEESCFSILLVHNPKEIKKVVSKFDLIYAGHLHGGQFVLWENKKGLYPGRYFYSYNFLRKTINETEIIISRGLGDSLPLRINCNKEILYTTIQKLT